MSQYWQFFASNGALLLAAWLTALTLFSRPLDRSLAAITIAGTGVIGWIALYLDTTNSDLMESYHWISLRASATPYSITCLGAALVLLFVRGIRTLPAPVEPTISWKSWQRVTAAVAIGMVFWAALMRLIRGLALPVEPISDGPIYHLYFAVRWFCDSRLRYIATPFGELAATYFPANGSAWFCWLLATFGNERLAKVGQFPFLVISAVAIYGLGRRLGAQSFCSAFPAIVWTSTYLALGFAAVPNVDLIFTAFALIGFYFLAGASLDVERPARHLVLAWLSFGLCLGTKTVALPLVVPWAILGTTFVLWTMAGPAPVKLAMALAAATACLCGTGIWYLQNIALTGNPIFPLQVSWKGVAVLDGCYRAAAMENSTYHVPIDRWRYFVDRVTGLLDERLLVLWAIAALAAALAGFGPGLEATKSRRVFFARLFVVAWIGQLATYWYLVPYNTQERFLLPAFALGIIPLALTLERRLWLAIPCSALVVWHLLTPAWTTQWDGPTPIWEPLLALPPLSGPTLDVAMTWGLPCCCFGAAWVMLTKFRFRWLMACPLVAAAIAVPLWRAEVKLDRDPALRFYPTSGFAARMLPAWRILEAASGPQGSCIGYAGTNLPYYLHGSRLNNTVRYVDVGYRRSMWLLHEQWLEVRRRGNSVVADSPYPQWHREKPNFDAWLANLRAAKIDLLFVARENYHGRTDSPPEADFPIEYHWALGNPEIFERLGPPSPDGIHEPWAVVFRVRLAKAPVEKQLLPLTFQRMQQESMNIGD